MPERLLHLTRARGLLVGALLSVLLIPALWVWPQRGLVARYHDNTNWSGDPVAIRVEPQLSLESVEVAGTNLPQQQFSLVMEGWLRIDAAGEYGFSTRSDDGSTLDVAGQRVVDNGGYHAPRTVSGTVWLDRGFRTVRLRYVQGGGSYTLDVRWTPPGGLASAIPRSQLYVTPGAVPGVPGLARHAGALWSLAWLALVLVVVSRAPRASLKTAVAAGSVLVTLLVVEVAIRIGRFALQDRRSLTEQLAEPRDVSTGGTRVYSLGDIVQPSAHEGIVYELKPNLHGVFHGEVIDTNSRGLRDSEYDYAKRDGTVRIVGLGDSSLFGWAVKQAESSLDLLERRLNDSPSGRRVDVINFAVPGYNTAIEAEVLVRKAVAYDPDVVIVNFNTNDYDVPNFMKLPEDYATLRKSFVFDFLYSRYEGWTGVRRPDLRAFDLGTATLTPEEVEDLDRHPGLPDEYRYMVGTRGFERAMKKIVTAARAAGVPVLVFDVRVFPGLHVTYEPNPLQDRQRDLLERLSQSLGFHWLNTYPYYVDYMKANPEAPVPDVFWVSDNDSHPSALAHRINADALYDYVTEQGWVGGE